MKKALVFALASFLLLAVSSCKKEVIIESSIVYTDEPPKAFWGPNEIYKQVSEGFITDKQVSAAISRGYNCNFWYDQNTGQQTPYDCGNWYLIPVHDYYGLLGGKIYVSKATKMAAITGNNFLNVQDGIKRKESVVVYLCSTGCNNPVGSNMAINGVK